MLRVTIPTKNSDVAIKKHSDNTFLKHNMKIDMLTDNIGKVVRLTTDKLQSQLIEITAMVAETNKVVFQIMDNLNTSSEKLSNTENENIHYLKKIAVDTISKYNQLKQEFDKNNNKNSKLNENVNNIHLDETLIRGLRDLKENNLTIRTTKIYYINAIILIRKLLDNK